MLIRAGEQGGDVFRVVEGDVEVVDTRNNPPVILEVLGRGSLVGEMSFVDERARSADVRAAEDAVCQRWSRSTIMRLIDQDPRFGVVFYRALAELAVARVRAVTSSAVAGSLRRIHTTTSSGSAGVNAVQQHADELVSALVLAEPVLRRDRARGEREILALLHNFQSSFPALIHTLPGPEQAEAEAAASRILHPYLMRSHLGELALDQMDGHIGDSHAVAHVLSSEVVGDGPVGEILDGWLLSLTTARGLRERNVEAYGQIMEGLPADPPARVTLINSMGAGLPAMLLRDLARVGGEVSVVESRKERMVSLQAGRASAVKLKLIQEDPLTLLRGSPRWTPLSSRGTGMLDPTYGAPQHVVLADALLEYLPDRVAVSLLSGLRTWLTPRGRLVVTALADSADDALWRCLLHWPTVRRSRVALHRLLDSAGLRDIRVYEQGGAGLVGVGMG